MGKTKITLVKHNFFAKIPQLNTLNKELHQIIFKADDFDLNQLKTEFSSLYQIFLSNKQNTENNLKIALFADAICELLISYYVVDYVGSELKKLKRQKKELEQFINHEAPAGSKERHQSIKDMLERFPSLTSSLDELNKDAGIINSVRGRFGASKTLAITVLNYIENSPLSDFIQELNAIIGNQSSFVDGIVILNESREILAIVGIILFTARLTLNLILLLKHVIEAALNEELSVNKVLMQELEKRGFLMVSDLVWGIVSVLTTYSELFQISPSAVSTMTLCFLVFDAVLLIAQWYFESTQYFQRLQELNNQLQKAQYLEKNTIQRQIDIINDEWEAQCHYYLINILAAAILASSFAISLLFTGPIALAGMALCSMIGNALYNTASDYKLYQKSKITVQRELANGQILCDTHHKQLLQKLQEEQEGNYTQFLESLGFNIGGVTFIIVAAVACWPFAVAFTVGFIGYQLYGTYQQHLADNRKVSVEHNVYRLFSPKVASTIPAEELEYPILAT